ncbi:terpenoid synthase, partial [Aureobasidium melanogenum]
MTCSAALDRNYAATYDSPPERYQSENPSAKLALRHSNADTAPEASFVLMQSYVRNIDDMLVQMDRGSPDYSSEACQRDFHRLYLQTATHFAQPSYALAVNIRTLQGLIQSMVRFVSYCWPRHSSEVKTDLCILFVYYGILDDWCKDNLTEGMQEFSKDMINGSEQKNTWWQAVKKHLLSLLEHYGSFCSLNMFRGTLDFYQGCWIEQHDFQGFFGSNNYPDFLRRLNGFGPIIGASLFPTDMFNETDKITSIASVISEIEQWELYVNDLLSFYKEHSGTDKQEQANFVSNYAHCAGVTVQESLSRILDRITSSDNALVGLLPNVDPRMKRVVDDFMCGYAAFHFTDARYRMSEFVDRTENLGLEGAQELRKFYDIAKAGSDKGPTRWAFPSLQEMIANHHK